MRGKCFTFKIIVWVYWYTVFISFNASFEVETGVNCEVYVNYSLQVVLLYFWNVVRGDTVPESVYEYVNIRCIAES